MAYPKVTRVPARNPSGYGWKDRGPQCEGEVSDQLKAWAKRCGKRAACSFQASYIVDSKSMCQRHAGMELIRLMLLVEEQVNANDIPKG